MHIAILHNAVLPDDAEQDLDVLVQADAVAGALSQLGHQSRRLACTLDLEAVRHWLVAGQSDTGPIDAVFNLVENLGGSDWLAHLVPSLLDVLGMPYSGTPSEGIILSAHKLLAKQRLVQAGLPTPPWLALPEDEPTGLKDEPTGREAHPRRAGCRPRRSASSSRSRSTPRSGWATSRFSAAAIGLRSARRSGGDRAGSAGSALPRRTSKAGSSTSACWPARPDPRSCRRPRSNSWASRPRSLASSAIGRNGTRRRSSTATRPGRSTSRTTSATCWTNFAGWRRACWDVFGLRGYARVDFRVDAELRPWILEVNSNPCLSPDAGFAAALERASIPLAEAVRRILDDTAVKRC